MALRRVNEALGKVENLFGRALSPREATKRRWENMWSAWRGERFGEFAQHAVNLPADYFWREVGPLGKVARIGAGWAALDVATRLIGPGGFFYDDYGRFNIAGVPFI